MPGSQSSTACSPSLAFSRTSDVYRASGSERIALPPNARFEASIVDASRADAAAPVFAKIAIDSPIQPPIKFEIPYDAKAVNPAARYSLRATISVDGKLWFTTDRITPVINEGAAQKVDLLLRRAGRASQRPEPSLRARAGRVAPDQRRNFPSTPRIIRSTNLPELCLVADSSTR